MEKTLTKAGLATILSAGLLIGYALPDVPSNRAPFEVRVTTDDGNLFIAGSGDSCREAWQGAQVPSNWHDIICTATR